MNENVAKKPKWLSKKIVPSHSNSIRGKIKDLNLNTVCSSALCPNISECFSSGHITFMIMGNKCTRECSFCNVKKEKPDVIDETEPFRISEAIKRLNIAHVVITSPTRDDLALGGADIFKKTVAAIKQINPQTVVEILIPDFKGDIDALKIVAHSNADVIGHNLETVKRLYHIRSGTDYARSLSVLQTISELNSKVKTKSGIMVGLGEDEGEILELFTDLLSVNCKYLSIGQYLQPSPNHYKVKEYIKPTVFDMYGQMALQNGFVHVESSPYARSSYNAQKYNYK